MRESVSANCREEEEAAAAAEEEAAAAEEEEEEEEEAVAETNRAKLRRHTRICILTNLNTRIVN